jgi:hypothetical protein
MVVKKILFYLVILIPSYLLYNIFDYLYVWEDLIPLNNEHCEHLKGWPGIEDLVQYENFIIGGSNDNAKLFELSTAIESPDGFLVYVNTLKKKLELLELVKHDFPSDIAFHPHGIYLRRNILYVINHAYYKGGERVEVFELVKNQTGDLIANYLRSILLPSYLMGISNDLVVVGDKDEILVTSYLPFADTLEGRDHSYFRTLLNLIVWAFRYPITHVYHCKDSSCEKVLSTQSIMNNGITYDENNQKVYVVNVFEKRLRVFKLNLSEGQGNQILQYDRDILLPYRIDNVDYDRENGYITAGAIVNLLDHQKIKKFLKNGHNPTGLFSGSILIDPSKGDKIEILLVNNSTFYGISSAIIKKGLVFHGSWFDDGLLICEFNKNK